MAPGGRKTSPDTAGPTTSVEPVSFPYRCMHVPHGGRIRYVAYLLGEGYATVRRIRAEDARAVFRLHFPRKRRGRLVRPAATLEVRLFEKKLWWPLVGEHPAGYPGAPMSAADFLDALRSGADIFGLNRSRQPTLDAERTKLRLQTARVVEDDREGAQASLQRKISAHILLIGDRAYAAGGEPVYVQRKLSGKARETTIVNLGCDRAPDPSLDGLSSLPGQCGDFNEAFERGAFQLADEAGKARAATKRLPQALRTMPRIEAIARYRLRMGTDDVRVDALFRYALDGRRSWNARGWGSEETRTAADQLRQVAAVNAAAATTTRDRFAALVRLECSIRSDKPGRDSQFRHLDRQLAALGESKNLRRILKETHALTAADDEVLASLGS